MLILHSFGYGLSEKTQIGGFQQFSVWGFFHPWANCESSLYNSNAKGTENRSELWRIRVVERQNSFMILSKDQRNRSRYGGIMEIWRSQGHVYSIRKRNFCFSSKQNYDMYSSIRAIIPESQNLKVNMNKKLMKKQMKNFVKKIISTVFLFLCQMVYLKPN